MPYLGRDVYADSEARAEWEALGSGVIPLVTQGERRLQMVYLGQLRAFLGLPPAEDTPAYLVLVSAHERVLEAVERAIGGVPPAHLSTPTPNRGRDIREMTHNIHHMVQAMTLALDSGNLDGYPPAKSYDFEQSRRFQTSAELADFAREVRSAWIERAALVDEAAAARSAVREASHFW